MGTAAHSSKYEVHIMGPGKAFLLAFSLFLNPFLSELLSHLDLPGAVVLATLTQCLLSFPPLDSIGKNFIF